jgi:nucleoside-diphosphate-sugar epimerase
LHLVIGAGEFLADHVTRALATEVPVIQLHADADDQTLADAITGIEVVINCAQTWSPSRRLRFRKSTPLLLERLLAASRRARVRRIVQVSTADVFGPDHFTRITERSRLRPAHAYERLKLFEERWLLEAAAATSDVEVVILRPARIFGDGEDWLMPRLMEEVMSGHIRLPGGGRATQTFVAASDVGRACLAAADRGRPGRVYLVGGFDSTWREMLETAARSVGFTVEIGGIPYDLAYLRALMNHVLAAEGAVVWPGIYGVDVLGKPHYYDDSPARRELTWSPSVGSFEQEMPSMAPWLSRLPAVVAAIEAARSAPVPEKGG